MLSQVFRLACAAALLAGVMVAPAAAQTVDKRTFFTFSGPVAVPGVTLPAGDYVFRLADADSGREVVQILRADDRTPYAMFLSNAAHRAEPAAEPEVSFMETAKGVPPAIYAWWHPGETTGYEFVYPPEQARRLAHGTSDPM